ncbi:MAG: ATP-binding cassette domain-containing protein [Bdellovibrionales bacterium]|nr:ATP-binding cassette domain-containing protein [Bdellovibrionales bacterium]
MSLQPPLVQFNKVSVRFGAFEVHKEISFDIYEGQVVTLLGPSGAGKTVILKLMIGLLQPNSGTIHVCGKRIDNLLEEDLREVRMEIGMLFQGAALFDSMNVYENISYALRERGQLSVAEMKDIVAEKLRLINLPGIENKYPHELSGGQKKRVGLARALASSPKIILFDEPTTGLDPTSVRVIDDLIIRLKRDFQITSIVVTHDIESARRISDRWMLVSEGKILADGPKSELENSNNDVKDFITGNWLSRLEKPVHFSHNNIE